MAWSKKKLTRSFAQPFLEKVKKRSKKREAKLRVNMFSTRSYASRFLLRFAQPFLEKVKQKARSEASRQKKY